MPLLHLVRHAHHAEVGRVLSGRSGIGLDAEGLKQADSLVAALAGATISRIYSSPRPRALQTAAPIAEARNLTVQPVAELDEIDFGGFTGSSFAALDGRADWHEWNARREVARCPAGETMNEAVARASTFLFALADEEEASLCCTHSDIIRGVTAHVLGLPMNRIFQLECDPASITTLSIEDGDVRLVTLNAQAL